MSDLAAWGATALYPLSAILGWALRRFAKGAFVERMRPHFWIGYAVTALALGHALLSSGNVTAIAGSNLWLAGVALAGLGLQTFVGLSLEAPGGYRALLRRWHVVAFWLIAVLIAGHVLLTV